MSALALQRRILDVLDEYEAKAANAEAACAAFDQAHTEYGMAATIGGTYVESPWSGSRAYSDAARIKRNLLKSAWKNIYDGLSIANIASAADKQRFDRELQAPPPLTIDNIRATFGDYLLRPRFHILKGLAECFVDLDPAYKSHSKVKIGVAGLPKRVVISSYGGYGSWGRERLANVLNALRAYRGQPLIEHSDIKPVDDLYSYSGGLRPAQINVDDLTLKTHRNGNVHVHFGPEALKDINRALAEFYGDVLPDVEPEKGEFRPSTAVSKDLQYYPTPKAVIDTMLRELNLAGARVLEPSCGCGRIMDAARAAGARVNGYEVHAGRAAEARAKGHAVVTTNFLEVTPAPEFDFVLMNPPFYGRHYVKHVNHAMRFLKPGGLLVSVLPATAAYDHKELHGKWEDLPVASFAESGTNVPTGLVWMRAAR